MLANVLHVLGAALVVGAIAVFDMRRPDDRYPEATRSEPFAIPVAAPDSHCRFPTGLLLLAAEATKLGINPAFYAKMAFIAIGLAQRRGLPRPVRRRPSRRGPPPERLRRLSAWILSLGAG